jgi:hypothetical protein
MSLLTPLSKRNLSKHGILRKKYRRCMLKYTHSL